MKNNLLLLSGLIGSILCITSYFIFSYFNSEYDHLGQSFSFLGSVGQPNNLFYGLLGFAIPGLLMALSCFRLKSLVNNGEVKSYPFVLIALSALLMALGGVPMNFNDYSSVTSILHIIGVMSSGLLFMIGGFTISKQLKKDKNWKPLIIPLTALVWVLIISGFFRSSEMGGLAQKIGILAYYFYISLLSYRAYYLSKSRIAVK